MPQLMDGLKWAAGAMALVGAALPGLSFFSEYAPPLFSYMAFLTSGLALFSFAAGFARRLPRQPPRAAARYALIAILCVGFYWVGFLFTSVSWPTERGVGPRTQIGFGLLSFSLTDAAKKYVSDNPGLTAEELWIAGHMNAANIWHSWSILITGVMLLLLFVLGFMFWTYAFGLLAKWAVSQSSALNKPTAHDSGNQLTG